MGSIDVKIAADLRVADFERTVHTTLRLLVHHRGQSSICVPAMGRTVPGIYGPTADTHS